MQLDCWRRLQWLPHTVVTCEVALADRSIDMVLISGGVSYAIEFKLSCTDTLLVQAMITQLAADYSYVCTPVRRIRIPYLDALEQEGVGYLRYVPDGPFPFGVKQAAKRNEPLRHYAELLPEAVQFSVDHVNAWLEARP